MNENTKSEFEMLKDLISSKAERNKLKAAIQGKKPSAWSAKSVAPYYKKVYGICFMKAADLLMKNPTKPFIYYFKDHPHKSPKTIYSMIDQGKRYMLENLDPNGDYAAFCEMVRLKIKKGVGIIIYVDIGAKEVEDGNELLPSVFEESLSWKDQLESWLDSDTRDPFVREHLALSVDEIYDLQVYLSTVDTVAAKITSDCIRVLKI